MLAILALVLTVLIQIPQNIHHNLLIGSFDDINFATGQNPNLASCFFYAGVLAFSEGMLPLKISAIASSHHRPDLPLILATTSSFATKWIFCFLASIVLMNNDQIIGNYEYALVGVAAYLLIIVTP